MAYAVHIAPAAVRGLAKLSEQAKRRVASVIDSLAANPRPPGAKKLAGKENFWRVRVGDYRVIYTIEDRRLVVLVVKVGHRGEVYRGV